MQLIVMQHKEVIGTLVSVDPDVALARRLADGLMRLGEGYHVVEVSDPCDVDFEIENSSCFP